MNQLAQVEVIVIDGQPHKPRNPVKFVATNTIAVRLTEVAQVASTLAECVGPQQLDGIRLLCKAFGIEVTK